MLFGWSLSFVCFSIVSGLIVFLVRGIDFLIVRIMAVQTDVVGPLCVTDCGTNMGPKSLGC